jgi:tetratricopeptide (TPR) repeat protein
MEARNQYQIVEVIDELYRVNGINTDLQLALFFADRDLNLPQARQAAESAYREAPSVYAADAYAWAEFKAGRLAEADALMQEALRLDTPEARFYYHAGLVRRALGDRQGAIAHLEKALSINPYFSPTQALETRRLLVELKAGR